MTLQKARISTAVDTLTYYSKNLNIITEWDGGRLYTINVYNENNKRVLASDSIRGSYLDAEVRFEELKTSYILK